MSVRRQLNNSHVSDPVSSDVEEDNLNENLNEFERNILIDEKLDIPKSQNVASEFGIRTKKPRDPSRSSTSYTVPGSVMDDELAASTPEATVSSADEETSSQGEMEIELPGLPVTADCPIGEEEQNDEEEAWSDTINSTFHGFTSEEIEEQQRNVQSQRLKTRRCLYDSSDDLITPFDNEQLLLDDQEDDVYNSLDYKLLSEGEGKGKAKHKQAFEDTSVFSSSQSPLKMVFKIKAGTMTTVSPSSDPVSNTSLTKSSRTESITTDQVKTTETLPSPSQENILLKGQSSARRSSSSLPAALDNAALAKRALPEPMRRESREWKPSAQFFKPLLAGWKREVIYARDLATLDLSIKPDQIVYHAPPNPGCKARSFKSLAELGSFLSSASSTLTLHNFSFRKELMNAPKNQEIARASDEEVVIFPKLQSSPITQPAPSIVKGSVKDLSSKPKPFAKQSPATEPGISPFSHGPKTGKWSQQYTSPNTSNPLLSGRSSGTGKLKPKVFSKSMSQERNVIESNSGKDGNDEMKTNKWSPNKSDEMHSSMYEDDDKLILDEGSNDVPDDQISRDADSSQEHNPEIAAAETASIETANLYKQTIPPAIHSNQLIPSISLTPISQTSSRTSTPPIAKHNLPATAMMTSSISPKPSAKKPSKQSKFPKLMPGSQISRPVLRPNDMTPGITCSIHCELASGFPALNCHKCQSLFHPVCVGLMEGPDYNGFDFYCADCSPPPGKENVQMPPPLSRKKPLAEEPSLENTSLTNKFSTGKGASSVTITPGNAPDASNDFIGSKYGDPQISITPTNGAKSTARWPQNQPPKASLSKSKSLKRPISSVDVSPVTTNSNYGSGKSKTSSVMSGTTTLTPVSRSQNNSALDEPAVSGNKKVGPLRPIEAQTVINIGGIKYLVVPHPPSSESKTENQQHGPSAKKKVKSSLPGINDQDKLSSPGSPTRLPFLLRPAAEKIISENGNSSPPTFEIEETKDGQLILIPTNPESRKNIPESMMRNKNLNLKSNEGSSNNILEKGTREKLIDYGQFTNNLSRGYFAMLSVFRYLTPQERAKGGRVCKVWKEIAQNASLWENVSLRNCSIYNWKSFAEHINRTNTKNLDVRKILHLQSQPTQQNGTLSVLDRQALTWQKFAESAYLMKDLERLDIPKIRATDLEKIISGMTMSPQSKLSTIIAASIVTASAQPQSNVDNKETNNSLDFESLSNVPALEELRIRAASGQLILSNLEIGLELMVSNHSERLKNLSLLSAGPGITYKQFEIVSRLHNLESLELGDCTRSGAVSGQSIPLNKLVSLKKLVHLRIEKGEIGREVGTLEMLTNLDRLELIDTDLKQGFSEGFIRLRKLKQLLLIPSYKEEVATVNSEIVDSVLSMAELNLFILGLTNEWLESMSSLLQITSASGKDTNARQTRDSFPILVNGTCEMFSLKKLYKTLTDALPSAQVKILKMPQSATTKQSILGRKI